MRRWLARVALPLWIVLYLVFYRSAVFTTSFLLWAGPLIAGVTVFVAVGIWSSIFYLLLCREEGFDRLQEYLVELMKKRGRGLIGRVREWFLGQSCSKSLLSFFWVITVFVFLDALLGVLTVRLSYSGRMTRKTLAIIWLGAAADVLAWILIFGVPAGLIQTLVAFLRGG